MKKYSSVDQFIDEKFKNSPWLDRQNQEPKDKGFWVDALLGAVLLALLWAGAAWAFKIPML